ncbi:protein NRT1/ PTR FAMILY 5.4-like [Magnolia sinica]|uniref:protein NRT1/ PTR FAMILY 5.4-like n=1 Tax=Magnolia sinica TaxID=86752 RepID=UPI002659F829|nr:protein NRT1/ PTR FAMILY 5.4-like [Magnolia sinica]
MDVSQTCPLLSSSGLKENCVADGVDRKPSSHGGWRSAIYIIWVEIAEQFAYFGISANVIIYLTNVFHEPALSAAKNVNIWSGVGNLIPLLGAFVADTYMGRYMTILFSSLLYLMGVATLTLSATPVVPHRFQKSLFYISLYVLAIGQGGQKPCAQAFGADQFNEESAQEMEAMNSFFNWWYFGTTCGVVAGIIIVSYVQEYVGWAIGFSIPAIAVAIALVTFLIGRTSYCRRSPTGSPLTQVAQVLVAAARKRHLPFVEVDQEEGKEGRTVYLPMNGSLIDGNQFRFLDKATIKDELDVSCDGRNAWRLCSTIQVEEAKQLLRLLPIWFSCLMYPVVTAQTSTFFTKQCSTLDRKIWSSFEVTPASFQLSIALSAILTVPIYDWIIVPLLRTITKTSSGITLLQRIGVGISLSVTCMVMAALVEARRLRIAREHGLADIPNATIPMSVWWLLPQDVICGVSNVLTVAGLNQFFYDQMPDEMRSLGSAAVASIFGVGNFLSGFILSFLEMINGKWLANNLNHGHLDYYYWLLAGLSTLWLGFYTSLAQCFVCKQNNDALR